MLAGLNKCKKRLYWISGLPPGYDIYTLIDSRSIMPDHEAA